MKRFLLGLACLSLAFSACSTSQNISEDAGKAMAETACLLFDEDTEFVAIAEETKAIMDKYGFENDATVEDYLDSIRGTEELNNVVVIVREHLESSCGETLEKNGIQAADLAEAMVQE
jgi:hypothetical protein